MRSISIVLLCALCACTHPFGTSDAGDETHDAGGRVDAAPADAGVDAGTPDAGSDAGMARDAGHDAGPLDAAQVDAGNDAGPACTCPDKTSVCIDGQCVNFCAVPTVLPGSLARTDQDPRPKSAVFCAKTKVADPDLTFDEVCKRRCLLRCERQAWFCAGDLTACQASCESDDTKTACASDVATCTGGDDSKKLSCLQPLCSAVKKAGCADTTCPGNTAANCTDVSCRNDSAKCGANFDGFCDDGDTFFTKPDLSSATETDSNLCPWGSDCADCGPRKGMNNATNLPLGAQCQYNSACAGNRQTIVNQVKVSDLATTEAWCVELIQVGSSDFRCVLDASGEGEQCPAGFQTLALLGPDTNGDGKPDFIKMGSLTGKVCVPASCQPTP